ILALIAVAFTLHLVTRRIVIPLGKKVALRTRAEWDEVLLEARVLQRAALLVPLLVFELGLRWVPGLPLALTELFTRLLAASMILVAAITGAAFLSALHALYLRLPVAATRPIKSYVQLAKVAVYIVAGIFIVARLAGQSPWYFVSGLGAMMAIILLIFRDTLLSL